MAEEKLKPGDKYGALTLQYYDNYMKCWICSCDCGKQNIKAERKNLLTNIYPCCGKCRRLGTWALKSGAIREKKEQQIQHKKIANNKNQRYLTINEQGRFLSSKSEKKVYKLLTNAEIPFECEKSFGACYPGSIIPFRFDFYVDKTYVIEFDGEQHFKSIEFYGGENRLKAQQWHDYHKNKWCKENNVPLIRIPYTKLDTLCIEDLMLKTTKFRVV